MITIIKHDHYNNHYKTCWLTFCLKSKRDTKNMNSNVFKTKNVRTMLLSKYGILSSKK